MILESPIGDNFEVIDEDKDTQDVIRNQLDLQNKVQIDKDLSEEQHKKIKADIEKEKQLFIENQVTKLCFY